MMFESVSQHGLCNELLLGPKGDAAIEQLGESGPKGDPGPPGRPGARGATEFCTLIGSLSNTWITFAIV